VTGISSWRALTHDTLAQKRNRALILLLSTGARSSEVLRFDRSEWKLERPWVLGKGDRESGYTEITAQRRARCMRRCSASDCERT
jgi:site-specific recombinase XerD